MSMYAHRHHASQSANADQYSLRFRWETRADFHLKWQIDSALLLSKSCPGDSGSGGNPVRKRTLGRALYCTSLAAWCWVFVRPQALLADEALLRASFDSGLDALTFGGEIKTPQVVGEVRLDAGRHGKSAFIADGASIAFPLPDGLNSQGGTVEFWVSPHGWRGWDKKRRTLVEIETSSAFP